MKVKAGHCLSLREKRALACRGILPLVCTFVASRLMIPVPSGSSEQLKVTAMRITRFR